jgi:hypothetical protein
MTSSRNRLVAAAMLLAAPLIVLGSYLFSVSSSDSPAQFVQDVAAAHTRYVVGGLLLTAGAFLLIPAAIGLMRLAQPKARVVVVTGGVLSGIAAAVLGGGYLMMTVVFGCLTPDHEDVATGVQQVANTSGLAGLPFVFAPLLVLGLVITGVGLLTGGLRPRWLPLVLTLGAVALHFAPDSPLGSLLHLPVAVAIAGLGAELLRAGASATATDRAPTATVAEQV